MATGLSIASIVIALSTLVWSICQGRRKAAALTREEKRREEEIELLRSQVERQAQERRVDRAAGLVGVLANRRIGAERRHQGHGAERRPLRSDRHWRLARVRAGPVGCADNATGVTEISDRRPRARRPRHAHHDHTTGPILGGNA